MKNQWLIINNELVLQGYGDISAKELNISGDIKIFWQGFLSVIICFAIEKLYIIGQRQLGKLLLYMGNYCQPS